MVNDGLNGRAKDTEQVEILAATSRLLRKAPVYRYLHQLLRFASQNPRAACVLPDLHVLK
jgi:hypothetical protein